MKPYEEIDFPNGFLRWIREDGMYVCRMTEEQMVEIKALHEAPRTWVKFEEEDKKKEPELPKLSEIDIDALSIAAGKQEALIENEKYTPTEDDLQKLEEELIKLNEQKFGTLEIPTEEINEPEKKVLNYLRRDA